MIYCKTLGGPVGIMICDGNCSDVQGVKKGLPYKTISSKPDKEDDKINEWCLQHCERLKLTIARDGELIKGCDV